MLFESIEGMEDYIKVSENIKETLNRKACESIEDEKKKIAENFIIDEDDDCEDCEDCEEDTEEQPEEEEEVA